MKRFSQFVNEEPFDRILGGRNRRLETDGSAVGSGPSFKDLTGVNLPPDDIVAAGIAGAGGQKLNAAGLTKYTPPPLSSRVATKVKDTAYDIVNKPSPYNPLTSKDIGTKEGSARYHAERQFEKETGRKPPTSNDIGNRDVNQQQLRKDQTTIADKESSLISRGYGRARFGAPEPGSNVDAAIPTRMPKQDPIQDIKKAIGKESQKGANMGAAMIAAKVLDNTREKRQERLK